MPISSSDLDSIVAIYKAENDALITNLGRKVVLFFKQPYDGAIVDGVDDQVRGENLRKPIYKNDIPNLVETTREIKALIQFDPKEFINDGVLNEPNSILRLKTFISELKYLTLCDYLIPNYDIINDIYSKYRIIRTPIPIGLRDDQYCISYWNKII